MAWTAQNLTDIEVAILALAGGTRQVEVTLDLGGGLRRFQYQQASLPQLKALRREMQAELNTTRTTASFGVSAGR